MGAREVKLLLETTYPPCDLNYVWVYLAFFLLFLYSGLTNRKVTFKVTLALWAKG